MTDLAQTLGTTEHDTLEFKRDASNRDAISKAICALANDLPAAGAGTLLIGVRDDGSPHGMAVTDAAILAVVNIRNEARVLPRPVLRVTEATYQGQPIICVDVTASDFPPVRFDGTVYVRVGPSSRKAFVAEERLLVERRQGADMPFEQRPVPTATIDDLDVELFASTYLAAAISAEALEENQRTRVNQLASLRFVTPDGLPTVAGVVVLGFDPRGHLPGAYVQFVRYAGTDVTADVSDQVAIGGNLIGAVSQVRDKLAAHNTTALVSDGGFRQVEEPAYPIEALREAVVNALVHRSYEANSAVRVLWFEDRVEIVNPGGPYGVVTDTNFDRIADYRNPTLAEASKTLGYMERFGQGIGRMRVLMGRNGNPPPEFAIEQQFWSVIMRARP
ncbi:hypothetical protein BH24ACT6_BH24ACT6_00090 [soil metagenome]